MNRRLVHMSHVLPHLRALYRRQVVMLMWRMYWHYHVTETSQNLRDLHLLLAPHSQTEIRSR